MRSFRLVVLGFALIFCLVTWCLSSNVSASDYLGNFCWEVTSFNDKGGPVLIKTGVTSIGDGHFILTGILTSPTILGIAINGNAEIVGNTIYVSIIGSNISNGNSVVGSTTMNATLDLNKKSGTYSSMNTYIYTNTSMAQTPKAEVDFGTVIVSRCP